MLVGQKEQETEILVYPREEANSKRGFTLVEILVVGFILSVVTTALFLTLSTGEFSSSLSSAKADLQAKVRLIMDMMVRDVRQTHFNEINQNDPRVNHIKFRKVSGIKDSGPNAGDLNFSPNPYIEYSYNPNTLQLTRSIVDGTTGVVLRSQVFGDITNIRFCSKVNEDLGPNTIIPADSRKLIITIAARRQVKRLTLNLSLSEEVKIRNE
jgi:prepilin-type N-terminal cleavage/methylation domain-containing protein